MTMSKASVSSTLQCWVTVSSPRHIVTSTPPKEWMVRPSPTLMATVLVFLKVLSSRFGPPWPSWGHLGCVSMCRQAAIG